MRCGSVVIVTQELGVICNIRQEILLGPFFFFLLEGYDEVFA